MSDFCEQNDSRETADRQQQGEGAEAALRSFAHDVCTPLASIKLAADLLISANGHLSEEALVDLGSSVSHETDRLRWMLDTVVEWSRLTCGHHELLRRWHLAEDLVAAACRRAGRLNQERDFEVTIEPDMALIYGDEALLELALISLLDNAAECSPPAQPVEVRVQTDETGCRVEVIDEGPHLDQQTETQAAASFDSRAGHTGVPGARLAMMVSREIIQAHDGTFQARNQPGPSGAVFWFTLEYGDESPPEELVAAGGDDTATTRGKHPL